MESTQAFTFDRVFGPTEPQEPVFEEVARPIVDGACVQNSCVLMRVCTNWGGALSNGWLISQVSQAKQAGR